jgi:hypothetical protein
MREIAKSQDLFYPTDAFITNGKNIFKTACRRLLFNYKLIVYFCRMKSSEITH